VYVGFVGMFLLFISGVIFSLIYQGWKADRV
jgi:hypothetical protein